MSKLPNTITSNGLGGAASSAALLALAAGEIHGTRMREAIRRANESKGDVLVGAKASADHLVRAGVITAKDNSQIGLVIKALRASSNEAALTQLQRLGDKLQDERASPLVITVSGITTNSARTIVALRLPNWVKIVGADLKGCLDGAAVGVEVGAALGADGAVVGAVVGGLIGGVAASISKADDIGQK